MATLNTKFCSKCKKSKDLQYFYKNCRSVDGLQGYCKDCSKDYINNNKLKIKSYQKKYRQLHKEKSAAYNKEYRQVNKKDLSEKKKQYRKINHKNIANKKLIYERNRMSSDPSFKLRKRLSLFIRLALNKNKAGFSILKFLPYSIEELKKHIETLFESWMNWQNWGEYDPKKWDDNDPSTWRWQIDHIIPQSRLPYASMEDDNFKKCWDLNNLRPYSAKQNVIEGAKLSRCK